MCDIKTSASTVFAVVLFWDNLSITIQKIKQICFCNFLQNLFFENVFSFTYNSITS